MRHNIQAALDAHNPLGAAAAPVCTALLIPARIFGLEGGF